MLIPMNVCRMSSGKLRRYTMVGSYPLVYHCKDGGVLCPYCADEDGQTNDPHDPQWFLTGASVNSYESDLHCDHCGDLLEECYPKD